MSATGSRPWGTTGGCALESASSLVRHASGTGMLNCLAKSKATITERLSLRTWPSTTSCWNSVRLLLPIFSQVVVTRTRSWRRICPM